MERLAIGIDVGGSSTKGALVDPAGTVYDRVEVPTEQQAATKSIIAVAESLMEKAAQRRVQPVAVGVGAAGFIDHEMGTVDFSPNLVYDDPDIRTAVEARIGLAVVVDNDANAATWGERTFGAAKGLQDVAMLTIGTGIGSGFVASGRLVRGATGAAAEAGHMVIDPSGPQCPCGLRGCLEQLASGGAMGRLGREAAERDPSSAMVTLAGSVESIRGEHVAAAAAQHDDAAMRALRQAGKALAVGLSNIVNLFDPQVIVLGGSAIAAGEPFLGVARDQLATMSTAQRRRPVRMDLAKLGNDAGIVGAAALAFDDETGEELP